MSSLTLSRYFILEQAFFKLLLLDSCNYFQVKLRDFSSTPIVFALQLFQDPTAKMSYCLHTHGYNYESLLINRQLSFMIHWSDEVLSRFFIWALELFLLLLFLVIKTCIFNIIYMIFKDFYIQD